MASKKRSRKKSHPAPIAITTGDHRGIGPEVISKGLHLLKSALKSHDFVILGIPELYRPFKRILPKKWQIWDENEAASISWRGPKPDCLNFVVPYSSHVRT